MHHVMIDVSAVKRRTLLRPPQFDSRHVGLRSSLSSRFALTLDVLSSSSMYVRVLHTWSDDSRGRSALLAILEQHLRRMGFRCFSYVQKFDFCDLLFMHGEKRISINFSLEGLSPSY